MSRGAKVTLGTVLVLALVLVLAYGADRWVAHRTEQGITEEVATATDGQNVRTEIAGALFFPQLLSGSLQQVQLSADEVSLEDLVFTDATATADEVTVDSPRTAGELTVTGTLPVETLQTLLSRSSLVPSGLELTVTDGRLAAEMTVLGSTLSATADPVVRDGAIYLEPRELTLGGVQLDLANLPGTVDELLGSLAVPTEALPADLAPTAIEVVDGGVRLTVSGTDLALEDLG